MTREELKQEAEELIQRFEMANSMNCYMSLTPDRKQIGEMLVMIAEPREKRIAELEAQIEKMKCFKNCQTWNEWQCPCARNELKDYVEPLNCPCVKWELRR